MVVEWDPSEIGTPGQSSPLPAVAVLLGVGMQFETG